ncbi:MAG: type II secretion system F family protein [Candidatus Paceibacterota bacterium]
MNKRRIETIINALKPRQESVIGDKIEVALMLVAQNFKKNILSLRNSEYLSRMPVREQIIFAKRLSILIKSGVPIAPALGILEKQSNPGGTKRTIGNLRVAVETGRSLARAMESCNSFGNFAVNVVSIGEASGTLDHNLNYLADELKKKRELKRNIIGALIYPAFIAAATLGIVILLMAYVFPKILPVFLSFKTDLPWSTKALIAVSGVMQYYWIYFLAGLALVGIIGKAVLKNPAIKLVFDRISLGIPLAGPMIESYCVANFCRTLGLLLNSEVGIIQALRIVGDTSSNSAYKAAFDRLTEGTIRGEAISEGMEKEKMLFPPLVSQMVGVGETTGNLSSSLMYLAEIYEEEMNNSTKNITTSVEPVLMIFMGVLVGFIAMSIITPIYGITKSLH